jgi:hypothetical protein
VSDFGFVAIVVVFFVLAGLFVRACDRIVGPEEQQATGASAPVETARDKVAA